MKPVPNGVDETKIISLTRARAAQQRADLRASRKLRAEMATHIKSMKKLHELIGETIEAAEARAKLMDDLIGSLDQSASDGRDL
jgi:alkanesulfonate monooxygenase SsuD/methylene tetrahydromethanopterin reductase-like flavin-dependent oxidoreductase (luciferase family)